MQQSKSSRSNDDKVSSYFSFILGPNQDSEYMKTGIKTFLSSVDVEAEVFDEEENGNTFGIDLSGVSLESLHSSPFELAYFLEKEFGIKKAEPRLSSRGFFFGGGSKNVCDDNSNREWHLEHVKAIKAWEYSKQQGKPSEGEGVVIAQIDTGYSDHDGVFTDDVWINKSNKGLNMFIGEDDHDPKDSLKTFLGVARGHGTVVAAVAVGRGEKKMSKNGNKYPRGTAPKAKLYSIRAMNNPVIDLNDAQRIIKAFDKILELKDINIDVISMSLGSPTLSKETKEALEDKIKKVITEKNIIVVAAGGQLVFHKWLPVVLPARFADVIAVGGYRITEGEEELFHKRTMGWWNRAQQGKAIDISGPAKKVCNAKVNKTGRDSYSYDHQEGEGTSLATAMTGGIAALWLAHHGKANLIQYFDEDGITLQEAFRAVLKLAANQDKWEQKKYDTAVHGHGMIDAEGILKKPLGKIREEALDMKEASGYSHTSIAGQEKAPEKESEDAAAHEDMIDFLLEIGYDKDTLKPFQENTDDLEHFVTELVYVKSEDNAVMSSALRAKLGQH